MKFISFKGAKKVAQTLLFIAVTALVVLPTSNAQADDFFKLKCHGENNNDKEPTLTLEAKIDVADKKVRGDEPGKGARWYQPLSVKVKGLKFYESTTAKLRGDSSILEAEDFQSVGAYDTEISDENENGIPDSILRFFEFSFSINGQQFNASATNQGQGGKNDYVLFLFSNSNIGKTDKDLAWTYCKLSRRWF